MVLALLILSATPVSLSVDLSQSTTARLGPRVRTLIEERLLEEGFSVEPVAKLKLRVEELHGTLRLTAQAGEHTSSSELRPALEWPAELGFELAQRLAVLAHEAEAHVPVPQPKPEPQESRGAPLPPSEVEEPVPEPAREEPKPEPRLRLTAGVRLGILIRAPSVDPTLMFVGGLPGAVEPTVAMGVVFAPGPGLTAWELPVLGGLRVPIKLGDWTLAPELLGGGRLHLYTASSLEQEGGARFDPLGTLGVSVLHVVGTLKLGARVGVELSTAREHREGDLILWSRGGFAVSAMIQLER